MEKWNWRALGVAVDPTTKEFDADELAAAYRAHNAEAEAWLKRKGRRYLKFNVKHGWAPLCAFVKELGDEAVSAACAEKVDANVPFPRANVDLRQVRRFRGTSGGPGGGVGMWQIPNGHRQPSKYQSLPRPP